MSRINRIARSLWADSSEREQLLQDYLKMISFGGQQEIHPDYIEGVRKQFMTDPLPELLEHMEWMKKDLPHQKRRWDFENQQRVREEERRWLRLDTEEDSYERTDDVFERAVCSDGDPSFEKKGMPAFGDELVSHDRGLRGYYGVHVGGGWLPIMVRDQYCEGEHAYLYDIDTSIVYKSTKPFYIVEDFHIMDRTETPNSQILFSKFPIIPAKLITLRKIIPVSKIKPAPDLY